MYNSFDINSPGGENFTPVKTSRMSSHRAEFFFSFLLVNTGRGLTTHMVEFNPGRNSHRGEILVVNRPLSKVQAKRYLSLISSEKRHLFELQWFLLPLTNTHYNNWFMIILHYNKMLSYSLKGVSCTHTHILTHTLVFSGHINFMSVLPWKFHGVTN